MQRTYPNKIWREPKEAPPRRGLSELARDLDARGLWPLLDAIEAPGFLSADHVGLLLFHDRQRPTKTASGQLKRLLDWGLIDAFRFSRGPQTGRGGSAPLIYCLTRTGAQLLAAYRGAQTGELTWGDERKVLSTFHVCHRLNTADFHVALAQWCRESGAVLGRFEYEPRYQVPAEKKEKKPLILSPDALAEVTPAHAPPLSVLVEIDRGTERPKYFAERATRYEAFYKSGEWERWLVTPPLVLVVATEGAENRVAALRDATAQVLDKSCPMFRRWRFTAGEWLYQVDRSSGGYAAPISTNFDRPVTLPWRGDEFKPLFGGDAT